VVVVPLVVLLVPALRIVPGLYAWRVKSRIYRWYGSLIAIERSALSEHSATERASLIERLDAIEEAVNGLKMPLAYADQFYVLREHIGFVRQRLTQGRDAPLGEPSEGNAEESAAEAAVAANRKADREPHTSDANPTVPHAAASSDPGEAHATGDASSGTNPDTSPSATAGKP
jgi:hypothetical protein